MDMLEPRSAFVDTDSDGVRLHYLEWEPAMYQDHTPQQLHDPALENNHSPQDTDTLPFILLHSLGATAHSWRLMADFLYSQHQLIAFDLRGHGLSSAPEHGYDMATLAEDVISAMARLGLGQVAVVGHGWGARVALVLAARHPALVSHLVLVDCPHVEPRHWPGMTREKFISEQDSTSLYTSRARYLELCRHEMLAFWSPSVERIVSTYVEDLPNGQVRERLHERQQRLIREALWEDRALSYYGKLTCPVLLVPAADKPRLDEDLPERLENADEFALAKGRMAVQVARVIQRCSVLWMPDTTHDIQLQRPQVLARAIASFVQE
jgi:pimeloyl-ACP methyl ester carboxylesterase